MSEFSKNQEVPQPNGVAESLGSSGSPAWLLFEWVQDNGLLLMIVAVVLVVVLWLAAQVITWSAVVLVVAAVSACAAWIWYLVARRRRAAETARKQLELFLQSCFDKVDVMPGSPVFELYVADLLRWDGHHDVRVVGGKGDGGVDALSIAPSGRPLALQCKRQKDPVPINVVRELQGSLSYEHRGRRGVIVTNATLTKDARALATCTGIRVIDRPALADWMSRTRDRIVEQGNLPQAKGSPAPRAPGTSSTAVGWAAVLLLIVFATVYAATSAHSPARAGTHPVIQTDPPPTTQLGPATVIRANFAAISRHDWHAVWDLWYHPAGDREGYRRMVSGYRLTARDVVIRLKASGDFVSTRVIAYETTGVIQIYDFSFIVRDGKIAWGRSLLVHMSSPGTSSHLTRPS